ncbi:MAG: GDP-mannose 4,6-dehydratase [Planctomycetia bacterium]|nr:GDP-mannose 4,6-dehydratase [Planctomycetia bacterium]
MKTVVVLGSNSFSGQDFVDLLLDDPEYDVIGVSRRPEPAAWKLKYRSHAAVARFRFFALDMNRDMPELLTLLDRERPRYIVNFAAQSEVAPSWERPEHWFQTNTVALAELVNHLRRQTYLDKYVHISSPEVYGTCRGNVTEQAPLNPSTPYAASKAAADMLLAVYRKQYGFPVTTVRATNVYGARQQLFKIVLRSIISMKLDKKISLHGGGRAVKSYIHVRDVSRGELAIMQHGELGEIYHLSPDEGIAVCDLVRELVFLLDKNFAEVTQAVDERPGQDAAYVIDSSLARSRFAWRPRIELRQGLEEAITWVDRYWNEIQTAPLDYEHLA